MTSRVWVIEAMILNVSDSRLILAVGELSMCLSFDSWRTSVIMSVRQSDHKISNRMTKFYHRPRTHTTSTQKAVKIRSWGYWIVDDFHSEKKSIDDQQSLRSDFLGFSFGVIINRTSALWHKPNSSWAATDHQVHWFICWSLSKQSSKKMFSDNLSKFSFDVFLRFIFIYLTYQSSSFSSICVLCSRTDTRHSAVASCTALWSARFGRTSASYTSRCASGKLSLF